MLAGTAGAGVAAIAGMTFPRSISAAQTPESVPPKTLSGTAISVIAGDPQSFNPDFQADDYLFPIAGNLYNSLFMLDNDYNVILDLATGYEVAEDGLSIAVSLNPLATWHDGTPVTGADVKYTLETIVADPAAPASSLISALSSVDVVDDQNVVLNLSRPSASIIGFLAWYGVFILPAHIYEGTDWTTNEANQAPIGSGPFKFVSYEAGSSVELEANENYFAEGPYLERMIWQIIPDPSTAVQALLNGEVDYAGVPNAQVPTIESNADFKLIAEVIPSPFYFGFNAPQAPLDNLEVRRAIGMAIDRDQIVATALGGYGVAENRYYPHVIEWASNPEATAPAFDVEGANALLDEQGVAMDGDTRFLSSAPDLHRLAGSGRYRDGPEGAAFGNRRQSRGGSAGVCRLDRRARGRQLRSWHARWFSGTRPGKPGGSLGFRIRSESLGLFQSGVRSAAHRW